MNHDDDDVLGSLKHDVAIANRMLAHEGVLDALGHVSARHPADPTHFFISRSLGPELVTPADIQEFDLEAVEVHGDARPSYAERAIHAALYAARPDVQAVCHNHAPSVIPFGISDVALRPVFHMGAVIGPSVPVWDIAVDFGPTDMLVRNLDQGRSLAAALGDGRVALMRGHGSVVVGASLREVVFTSVYLEQNARLQLQALALGPTPHYLSDAEVERTSATLLQPLTQERTWATWRHRVESQPA